VNAPLPLQGLGVVITRPAAAADSLAASLAREGAHPFVFSALVIEPVPSSPALEAALDRLPACGLAIFVSANAVEHGLAAARRRGPWPASVRVAAIGEATAQALRNSGFARVISPEGRHDSETLLAHEELRSVEGLDVLIFRGAGGRELLRDTLSSRGARVTYAECYRRARPAGESAPLVEAWARGAIQAVSVLSAETLENFVEMVGEAGAPYLGATALIVAHPAVAAHPLARRFGRVLVAGAEPDAMARALATLRVNP